jgi:hypothetical protein
LNPPNHHSMKSQIPSHTPGTTRAEDERARQGAEPGRERGTRTARDSTSINAKARDPIDPRMPYLPPA